ncbi:MAG: hypothetical protein WB783_17005 [Arenicellales bacterium]
MQLVHQTVGYPVAFLLVPFLLLSFAGKPGHRTAGWAYLVLMTFLYGTGTFMTLTRHEWLTWAFARNVTFNFFGYSLLLYGLRAAYLLHRRDASAPRRLDYGLAVVLTASVVALASVAVWKDTPMRVFTLLGIVLIVLEWRDVKARFRPRSRLFNRHARFVLGSYFYVLTVVSVVHLNGQMPRNLKWLWPTSIAIVVIYLITSSRHFLLTHRRVITKSALAVTGIIAVCFGAYAVSEFLFGPLDLDMADLARMAGPASLGGGLVNKRLGVGPVAIETVHPKPFRIEPESDPAPYLEALRALQRMLAPGTWALAGGLAVPITMGCFYRRHGDVDIVMPLGVFSDVVRAFRAGGYELYTSWAVTHHSRGLLLECRIKSDGPTLRLRPRRLYVRRPARGVEGTLLGKIDLYPYRDRGSHLETCNSNRVLAKRTMRCSSLAPFSRAGQVSCLDLENVACLKTLRTGAKHQLDCVVIRDGPDAAREWFKAQALTVPPDRDLVPAGRAV